ncbi:MAG: hypothetical protein J4F46_06835 [Dehalococcoidia bacterium]|nr:hypothetical protein [Dehalococcoidia bacterium]
MEAAGIPTISMTSALDITQAVKPPRSVFVNFPLGHQTGKPHQPELQRSIVRDALRALETITTPGEIVTLPYVWDEKDDSWEDGEYRIGYLEPYVRADIGGLS